MSDLDRPDFDMFAAESTDSGDEYSRLVGHVAMQNPKADAQREAAPEARDAAQAAELEAWRVRLAERKAVEEKEAADRQSLEQARCDEMAAKREVQIAASEALFAARRQQDDDYHAWEFQLCFRIDDASWAAGIDEETDPALWELSEDVVANYGMIDSLKTEIITAIEPLVSHYRSLGLVRADFAKFAADRERGDGLNGPMFFLVHRAADAVFSPDALALEYSAGIEIDLATRPGDRLHIYTVANPTNATLLHSTAQCSALGVNHWGGEETPDMPPAPDESRAEWLARVALGKEVITRAADRWAASGRDPLIYRHFGDFTERSDGDREVECLVYRRIFRGALTFVVGDSGVGKSSLVHEWVAALSGAANGRPTSVLGADVPGRHICALISAEDGLGRISQRAKDHAKIWDRCTYFTPPDPLIGLEEHLETLRQFPQLDLVVFDPLRSYLDGNEDSSDVAERVCDLLGKFAREMNCAVVLPHHIKKAKLPPRTIAEVYDRMRGSTAFKASARMVICILKRRDGTVVIGPAKHNFADGDVWLPLMQGDTYRVDPETSTLIPVDGLAGEASGPDNGPRPLDLEPRVLAAIQRNNSAGNVVRRSGKLGLFESRPPELASLARATILDTVAALLASGSLVDGPTGLRLAARPEVAGEGSTIDI